MKGKVESLSPISTSNSGWSTIKAVINGTEGEVFLGKNISTHELVVGMEVDYDVEDKPPYGNKFRIIGFKDGRFSKTPPKGMGGGFNPAKEKAINASVALSKAVELVCNDKLDIKQMYSAADKMLEWLMEKSK